MHNMRMRCNKSAGGMANSAVSRCVYTGRRVSSGTLKFLQQNPWLTCQERLGLLQTWCTCGVILQLWILSLTNQLPPSFSHSLSTPNPPPIVAMTTKASLSVSHVQSVHLGGYLAPMHDSRSLSLSANDACSFYHKPTFSHIIHPPPDTRTSLCFQQIGNRSRGGL